MPSDRRRSGRSSFRSTDRRWPSRPSALASRIAQPAGSKLRLALVHQLPAAPLDAASARVFTSIDIATRKSERAYLRAIQVRLRGAALGCPPR